MSPMKTSTLRPGLLVSLKTHVVGNVQYSKTMIEDEHLTKQGLLKARWETERLITDADELKRAKQAIGKASTLVRRICTKSVHGLLCPLQYRDDLMEAVLRAREIAELFNETAQNTAIEVNVLIGEIAADDVEAVRSINSELRGLLDDMQRGIRNMDVKVIREAAAKARQAGQMLSPEANSRVRTAIEAARNAAKDIVKAGDVAEIELDRTAIRRITEARSSFLDIDADEPKAVKRPKARGRSVDLNAE